ncbi:hypothetical protein [Aquimarina agarivorans]|uniref:hypothetical protein n=1 Tax=Aquimarina agarivorans TaxID=980584 RepID=UPI000248FC5D|nr:hypothetical protein [Aquimarina agarivorans]
MKNWKGTVVTLALFGIIVFLIMNRLHSNDSMTTKEMVRTEQLKDSLQDQTQVLDNQIEVIEIVADSLEQDIADHHQKIIKLKETQHEKATRIYNASDVELLEFFSRFKTKDSIH